MTKVNKIKNYEQIMNLICKIEKIKEDIFKCQKYFKFRNRLVLYIKKALND